MQISKNNVYLSKMHIFKSESKSYPFSLSLFKDKDFSLDFKKPVTILHGDNGIGKSTILKAIAEASGFSALGGSHHHNISPKSTIFGKNIRLSWLPKVTAGFFFRADKLSDMSTYLDELAKSPGGRSVYQGLNDRTLEEQSHGEAVFALLTKYTTGSQRNFVILDEPESSLSVASQIGLVQEILRLSEISTQFVISTHSPVILSTPNADILEVTSEGAKRVKLKRTAPYLLTREIIKHGTSFFEDDDDFGAHEDEWASQ